MSLAFLLLRCDDGSEKQVLKEITEIAEVKEARETFGPFGAVVKIESNNEYKVKQILHEKIQSIHGINSSLTLLAPFDGGNDDSHSTWEDVRGLSWMFYDD